MAYSTSENLLSVESVRLPAAGAELPGDLSRPPEPHGLVLFVHGSGSSRRSGRNRFVAHELNRAGFATLLFDLLTEREEEEERITRHLRFDIPLLASRLVAATDWAAGEPTLNRLPVGYFGASTGGGAALVAAAERPERVQAVVSRGGRPDLAGAALPRVVAPTLLMVGGDDRVVIDLNRAAMGELRVEKELEIVPGAGHLFEEPGALDHVAAAASKWFQRFLGG